MVPPAPAAPAAEAMPVTGAIESPLYRLEIDLRTGALASLKTKDGVSVLAGESNVVVSQTGSHEHFFADRAARPVDTTSSDRPSTVTVARGLRSTTITVTGRLGADSPLTRTVMLHDDDPRIDFRTVIDWRGSGRIVSVAFKIATTGPSVQGIPFGHVGRGDGLFPTIQWSDHPTAFGGVAVFDRGIPNRETLSPEVALVLLNSVAAYMGRPCPSLEGKGENVFEYAILPHRGSFREAHVPAAALDYNVPIVEAPFVGGKAGDLPASKSYVRTSRDATVAALRREGKGDVVRLVDLSGAGGDAAIEFGYVHRAVGVTNLLGEPTGATVTGSVKLKPQEFATIAVDVDTAPVETKPFRRFSEIRR